MKITVLSKYFCMLCILLAFCITNFTWAYSSCLEDQKHLLLQLRNELELDSSLSSKLVKWNETKEECCSCGGVDCDGEGHVISLQLNNEMISGEINDSSILFSFRHLQKLNLANNNFDNSMIPSAIQNLTHLTHLNLSYASFIGQVPLSLSLLRNLVSLDLSSDRVWNYMSVIEIPNLNMILHNLSGIRELYLDGVNISGHGGDWGYVISSSLPNLQKLSLRGCALSGPLHSSLAHLHSLSVLRLDYNNLSTTIPDFFANFSSLTTLTLSYCLLKGRFPDMIFHLPGLQYLDLLDNSNLSSTLPQFPRTGSLRMIRLGSTNFSTSLPNSIGNLEMLSEIDLSGSNFIGTIPFELSNLVELTRLDLSWNSFTGPIPSFYKLRKLTYVDLSHNNLTGSLSSVNFEGNSNLVYLDLGSNSLGGRIPQSLFGVASLRDLILSNNHFSGPVNEFSTLHSSKMERLYLGNNRLEGPIPKSFFNFERLSELSLSYNSFNGTVNFGAFRTLPLMLDISHNNISNLNSSMSSFVQLSSLYLASCNLHNFPNLRNQSHLSFLDLSNNNISGEIPSWIWEIGNGTLLYLNLSSNQLVGLQKPYYISEFVKMLDLHSNQLQGQLPSIPSNVQNLDYIDFSNNKFEGPLPLSIGNFARNSGFLSLATNSLSGSIPKSLCRALGLQVLDLSSNNFNGGIPPCLLKDLEKLGVLNLGKNNISGSIPDSFSMKCELQTLDLQRNNLEGHIPPSLANCKSLEVLNVGNNEIKDKFPCMIPSSLRVLVLRSNKFHGEIRCRESWPNLQIIDIACNNFGGYLYPMNLSSLRGMLQYNDAPQRPDHLSFNYLSSNLYYVDTVTLTFKAHEFELTKILTIFTSIDFSGNNFQGGIPNAIGNLKSLYVLNFSHNALIGTIPKSLGNLLQLGSLDLSMNWLTGEIPEELAGLTFLSVLNLSYNKLVGAIPQGHQFQTFSASAFKRNIGLCGFPLDRKCSDTDKNSASGHEEQSYEEGTKWEYLLAALGFGVGFGSVVWLVFGCERIRPVFSEKADQIFEYMFVKQQNRRRGTRRKAQRNHVRRQ